MPHKRKPGRPRKTRRRKKQRGGAIFGAAASLLAPAGHRLVLEQSAAPVSELDVLLDGQRWAYD